MREKRILWWLPLLLALLHALFSTAVYSIAFFDPRSGLLPILVFLLDYPFSYAIEWAIDITEGLLPGPRGFLIDGVAYTLLGSLWFFALGSAIRRVVVAIKSRSAKGPSRHNVLAARHDAVPGPEALPPGS